MDVLPAALLKQLACVRAVFFDLDGTLVDSIADLADSANAMLQDYGKSPLPLATIQSYVGRGIDHLVRCCFEQMPADAPAVFRRHYEHYNGRAAAVYPGVTEGLQTLQKAGFQLACITNKAQVFVPPLLAVTGLERYFSLSLGGDSLPLKKPDPAPLLHACRHFGISPQAALMVGDSANDIRAARAAACPVICVPYGYSHGNEQGLAGCDAIVSSIALLANQLTAH